MTAGQDLVRALRRAVAQSLRGWALVQTLALLAAAAFAANAARILDGAPQTADLFLNDFDQAALWLGLALLALAVAAWRPLVPRLQPESWRPAIAAFWRAHRVEIVLFALIIAAGVFMRFFRFNTSLPPEIGLCCEEHINGGVAYDALHGDRPVLFPLVRWTSALGFLIFGETTFGLRVFFPVMGVATLIVFYFLARQLVSVQTALFGLALYAVAWWPALRNRQTAGGELLAVFFAFLLVRALRTRSPLLFLAAGVLAGLLSYEYESYRAVPIIAVAALGATGLWLVIRGPLADTTTRATELLRTAWRPALIFLMAAGIVLVPMIVGTAQGKDFYLTSVHRQEDDRAGSRIADGWEDQLQWAAQLYLPIGPKDFPVSPPREAPGVNLLDPLTASLAMLGVAAGLVFAFRGYRFWFVSWVLASLAGGALTLSEFAPWSFFGLMPVLLLLAAFFVEDVRGQVAKRLGAPGARAFAAALVAAVVFSFWWNADTLFNDVAESHEMQRVYGGEISHTYAMCNYLRDRGDDSYAYAFSSALTIDGFAGPRGTDAEQRRAWGDFIWACHDLQGEALPAPEEAWPLRDLPAGPVALVFADSLRPASEIVAELKRVYPGIGDPSYAVDGPGGTYELIGYEFDSGNELRREGLWARYTDTDGVEVPQSRPHTLDGVIDDAPLAAPFIARWTGLIYVAKGATARLALEADDPAFVTIDGATVFNTSPLVDSSPPSDLLPGWHPIEVTLRGEDADARVRLVWVGSDGTRSAVAADDLFPLEDVTGWTHERSVGLSNDPRASVTHRLDFTPHMARTTPLRLASPTGEAFVTEERWRGVVQLAAPATLRFSGAFRAGNVTLDVSGKELFAAERSRVGADEFGETIDLPAGRHEIELTQTLERDTPWSGVELAVEYENGEPVLVTPY